MIIAAFLPGEVFEKYLEPSIKQHSTTIQPPFNNLVNEQITNPNKYTSFVKLTWYHIAEHPNELNFSDNNIAVTEVKGKKICIGKFNDKLFAFAFKCPHAGGFLADGYIDAIGNVVCPLHRYKYNIENGRNTSGEGYYLKHWKVEEREDGVYVEMEERGLFGW